MTNWTSRATTAADAVSHIGSGMRVFIQGAAAKLEVGGGASAAGDRVYP
jgi:hypothetical protein